jgi:hypothetical protein
MIGNILKKNKFFFENSIFSDKEKNIYNKTLHWYGTDKEEWYDSKDNLYSKDDITYTYNSHGFRCDSFNIESKVRVVFLGCSHTEGIGIRQSETWAWQILEKIKNDTGYNIPYWNLGMGGCGLDSIIRAVYYYQDKLKPHIIFGYFPTFRKEFFYKNFKDLNPYSIHESELSNNEILIDKRNIIYENEKNMAFLGLVAEKNNSLLIWNNIDNSHYYPNNFHYRFDVKLIKDKKARDKKHSGADANAKFANTIYSQYKDLILNKIKSIDL